MKGRLAVAAVLAALLGLLHATLGPLFPNAHGGMADDFMYYLPKMLDGYFWGLENGSSAVRWFTPGFCGGMPAFADPQDVYYSLAQVAFGLFGPVTGIYLTFVVFAAAGMLGMYGLLRCGFGVDPVAALAGAGTFLFWRPYLDKLLGGQVQHHSLALVPLVALALVMPHRGRWGWICGTLLAAVLIAYMVLGGLGSLMPPAMLAVAAVVLAEGLWNGRDDLGNELRSCAAVLGAGLLLAAKLTAVAALMGQLPRDLYTLPAYPGVFHVIGLVLRALAGIEPDISGDTGIVNDTWELGAGEYREAIGPVALALAQIMAGIGVARLVRDRKNAAAWMRAAALLAVLAIPVAVNVWDPDWNRFLKSLPGVGSSSSLARWWVAYGPVAMVAAALAIASVGRTVAIRAVLAVACVASAVWTGVVVGQGEVQTLTYQPTRLVQAWQHARASGHGPAVTGNTVAVDALGRIVKDRIVDEAVAMGGAHIFCYQALFGYGLERLPIKTLRPGPALMATGNVLNIKNPACYVYPLVNGCMPGDHFRADEVDKAKAFLERRPFPFRQPFAQDAADWVSLLAMAAALGLAVGWGAITILRWRR